MLLLPERKGPNGVKLPPRHWMVTSSICDPLKAYLCCWYWHFWQSDLRRTKSHVWHGCPQTPFCLSGPHPLWPGPSGGVILTVFHRVPAAHHTSCWLCGCGQWTLTNKICLRHTLWLMFWSLFWMDIFFLDINARYRDLQTLNSHSYIQASLDLIVSPARCYASLYRILAERRSESLSIRPCVCFL